MKNIFTRIAKDSFIYGFSRSINRFLTIFLVPIYTKIFSASDYGTIELIGTTFSFFGIILSFGLSEALFFYFYKLDNNKEKKEISGTVFTTILIINIISSFFIITFSSKISFILFKDYEYDFLIIISGFGMVFSNLSAFLSTIFRLNKKPMLYLYASFLSIFLAIILSLYFVVFLKQGILGALKATLISRIIVFCLSFFFSKRFIQFNFSFHYLKKLLSYGIPLVPGALSLWTMTLSNRFFINTFLDVSEVGMFSIAFKIATALTFITFAVRMALGPIIYEIAHNSTKPNDIYNEIFKWYYTLLCFFISAITLFGIDILYILTHPKFYDAEHVIFFLCLSSAGFGIAQMTSIGIAISKKTKYESYANLIGAAISIVLNIIFIPKYGIIGAAYTSALTLIIINIIQYYYSKKFYNLNYDLYSFFIVSLMTIACYFLSRYLNDFSIENILFKISILVSFVLILFLVKIIDKKKVNSILKF